MSAGFGDANGGDGSGGSDGKGKGDGALLAGAAGGGGVFGFGLADAGGCADDSFFCRGAGGGCLAVGCFDFLGGELLSALFFELFAGEFTLPCQFAFACGLGFLFLFQDGGINFWRLGFWRRRGLDLRRGGFRFGLGNGLRLGHVLRFGVGSRRVRGHERFGSRLWRWFLKFDEAEVDEGSLFRWGVG